MNATHRSPLKLVKQSVGWNNAKEQICNQCTSRLRRYLWFTYESGGIFPTSSAVVRSRFLAGIAITNISMQLALLYSELDYLTYNPTSRHGTGYTFTWPWPTVEPLWLHVMQSMRPLTSLLLIWVIPCVNSLVYVICFQFSFCLSLLLSFNFWVDFNKTASIPMFWLSSVHDCITVILHTFISYSNIKSKSDRNLQC